MTRRTVDVAIESFPLARPFRISRAVRSAADVVVVTIGEDGFTGRGEGRPTERYGESPQSARADILDLASALEAGLDRESLQQAMRPGAARNAVDCALWDLEAKQAGCPVWQLAQRAPPARIETAFSLSLDSPASMAEAAFAARGNTVIKIKLGGDGEDAARIAAVRGALGHCRLIADANEALDRDSLMPVLDAARRHGLEMLEQPLPAGADAALGEIDHETVICADESCRTCADLPRLAGLYAMVNIKLDKTGGLTEALKLDAAARAQGFKIMAGCMFSTSLGIAPAQLLAAAADLVDLDAPLFLAADRAHAISFDGSSMALASPTLWG